MYIINFNNILPHHIFDVCIKWINLNEYQQGKLIIRKLNVVNYSAERGIKLVQDF